MRVLVCGCKCRIVCFHFEFVCLNIHKDFVHGCSILQNCPCVCVLYICLCNCMCLCVCLSLSVYLVCVCMCVCVGWGGVKCHYSLTLTLTHSDRKSTRLNSSH